MSRATPTTTKLRLDQEPAARPHGRHRRDDHEQGQRDEQRRRERRAGHRSIVSCS